MELERNWIIVGLDKTERTENYKILKERERNSLEKRQELTTLTKG